MSDSEGTRLADRIRRIREVLGALDSGSISAVKAVSRIEDIASGEDDRIVHVGETHKPEITT